MHLLAWVGIGAVVGWGTGRIFQGNGYGLFMDILMGIGGAVVGGLLTRSSGFGGYGGTIITTLVAMIGAALMTALAAYVNGRRVYARQL
ncbi:MAG TPA: GlsB/YeaQ/YmgE family stress response membrane protein [Methylomirabilota bacterium]|nr:GlsB/YeaQ/YmgE family stress response membrane protein [Methylomirabilota bacterium]